MKVRTYLAAPLLAAALLWLSGCGSSNVNQVLDSVSPSATTVIAGTTQVFTSTVTGSTDLNSAWTCTYVYTPAPTTSVPNPKPTNAATCTSGQSVNGGTIGTWTTDQTTANNTLSYTAPPLSKFPNPIPTITFTATAEADKKKTGTAQVGLDTGIRIAISPTSATAPVGLTPAQLISFTATLASGPPLNLNWAVQQPVLGSSTQICTDFPPLVSGGPCGLASPLGKTCSPSCGSIDPSTGIYTAPATIPTDTHPDSSGTGTTAASAALTVTVLAWESGDIYHYAVATITMVNISTNPITFTGIHPTTIAAGGILQDVWLDARNILNTTPISFTTPNGTTYTHDATNTFTVPITAAYCTPSATGVTPVVTCDASILTRIRLNADELAHPGTATITVSNIPSAGGQATSKSFPINLVYAKPALVAAVPESFPTGIATQLSADGGYYGNTTNALVQVIFNGSQSIVTSTEPRQFTVPINGSQNPTPPGLYPVSVAFDAVTPPPAPPFKTATTNVAVQPTFPDVNSFYFTPSSPTQPQKQKTGVFPPTVAFPAVGSVANVLPSSMAVNSTKGYALITEQGSNSVQLVNFSGSDPVLPGRAAPVMIQNVGVGSQPTGVAIDNQIDLSGAGFPGMDLAVVVNSGDSTLTLLAASASSLKVIGSPISLSGLVQEPTGTTAPLPFAVGIDPTTHYAIVAFSNATLGFIVYVNPNPIPAGVTPQKCFVSTQNPPCAVASVSLNTGATPAVVMQPDAPLAFVTPGGTGVISVVNLLLTNNSVAIAAAPNGASCTNGIATITTPTPNGLNQAAPGAVLIAGVTPTDFDGTYNVTSASTYTFTYALTCATNGETGGGGSVTFGNPYYTFSTSPTASGAAINPITHTFAYADPNASSTAQVNFIRGLDQSLSSLFLTLGSCSNTTFPCTPIPAGAPETGIRSVAWDPFTNVLVAYDPAETYNLISLVAPGGPTANGQQGPYRIMQAIATGQSGTGTYTPSGSTVPVNVYGPMGYDPKTNLVLVANAGSNTLSFLDINPSSGFKPINISTLQVTAGGVPSSQPPLASAPGAPNPLPVATCDPTSPTNPYASCFPQSVTVGQAATLTILGQGFGSAGTGCNAASGVQVRLDQDATGITCTVVSDSQITAAVAASRLTTPHDFALDVISAAGLTSNVEEVYAVGVIDLSKTCGSADMPEAVAFDDERNIALVTNYGCNNVAIINMDSTNAHNYGVPYGSVMSSVTVGTNPLGIAVIPRLGYAVTANNGDSSASIIDISAPLAPKALPFTSASCTTSAGTTNSTNICVGIAPSGVAIDQDRALAIIANTGGNSISSIDLTPLLQSTTADCANQSCVPPMQLVATSGPPTAVAIDPNRAEAVVTNIQNTGTTVAAGGLDVISLATVPPSRYSTVSINTLTANPTSIVYDPAILQPCTSNTSDCGANLAPGLFYVSSTQENAVYVFNPDSGSTSQIRVGVNPYSLGYNYQTGTLLTINSTSNTSSVIDTVNSANSVFSTRETLGIGSQSQFAVAVDNFTNTAVIADQNNNRVLILALPR